MAKIGPVTTGSTDSSLRDAAMGYTAPRGSGRILSVQIEGRKRPCRAVREGAPVREERGSRIGNAPIDSLMRPHERSRGEIGAAADRSALDRPATSWSRDRGTTVALTPGQKDEFFEAHLPHRLCLLMAFRDRQPWFKERIGQKDGDLLRTSKDATLISIRLFANFLGLKLNRSCQMVGDFASRKDWPNDVNVIDLGGAPARLDDLTADDRTTLEELLKRADKELAHLTSSFADQLKFNSAAIMVRGIDIIERLLREKVYAVARDQNGRPYPFPTLEKQKTIYGHECEVVGGYPLT